jgi:glycosyltransferase involved in cell wall biosynthesis
MISVVIPTYNEEKYLDKALKSIISGSIAPDEIIIVDDNSQDRTVEIAISYNCKIWKVDKRNIGFARDFGMKVAKGDILVSTSADVIVDKDWLKNIVESITNYDMVFGSILVNSEDKVNVYTAKILKILQAVLWKFGWVWASADNIAIRKEFYYKIGGFKHINLGEDIELIKRAKNFGKVYYNPNAIIYTSDRRVKKMGKINFLKYYVKQFIKLNVGKIENIEEYPAYR